jgi:hypothetical protein
MSAIGVTAGESLCVCGHTIGWHKFDYDLEEFDGCQICNDCPSIETFAKFIPPVIFDGTTYTLRPEFLGQQTPLTVAMLVTLGQTFNPTFCVRRCSWCKSILGLKPGVGLTDGICTTCSKGFKSDKSPTSKI